MLITNNTFQAYFFGPLYLAAGLSSTLTLDDTSATSLYLTDDIVADQVNTLAAGGQIVVTGAAQPFPRPVGTPEILHGDGSPEGLIYAAQGSTYIRKDTPGVYQKTTGLHSATGWTNIISPYTGPKFTMSSVTGSSPSSPTTGDVWFATGVNSGGGCWQFVYDGGEATAYKWKFIGGCELTSSDRTGVARQNANAATWEYIAGSPTITVPRAGYYKWNGGASVYNASSQMYVAVGKTAGPSIYLPCSLSYISAYSTWDESVFEVSDLDGGAVRAANDVLDLFQWSSVPASSEQLYGWLSAVPIKVS